MRFPGNFFNNIVGSKVELCELLFITNQPSSQIFSNIIDEMLMIMTPAILHKTTPTKFPLLSGHSHQIPPLIKSVLPIRPPLTRSDFNALRK